MAVSDSSKVDYLFKKLGFSATRTNGDLPASAEPIPSPLVVPSSTIWNQSDDIPFNAPPATSTDIVAVYDAANPIRLTVDARVTSNRTWLATTTWDDTTTLVGNWIDPGNFGASYLVQIFKDAPDLASGGTKLFPTGTNNDGWFFDYASGVLNFNDSNLTIGVNASTELYLLAYRYTGGVGAGGGSASITISDTAPEAPEAGAMWWHSNTGDLLIYYDDLTFDGGNQGVSAQWVSALSGGGFFTLNESTNTITTTYNISSSGTKNFKIEHPLPELKETHNLAYIAVEGPSADLLFHGRCKLNGRKSVINIDQNSNQTEGTFELLCRDSKCFVTNLTDWTQVRGKVVGNEVIIEAKDDCDIEVDWMVVGIRKDPDVEKSITYVNDEFVPEVLKEVDEKIKLDPIQIGNLTTK